MVYKTEDDLGIDDDTSAGIACGEIKPIVFPLVATCTVTPDGKESKGGTEASECFGTIRLVQEKFNSPTEIEWDIKGLDPGQHGFHIHEQADFRDGSNSAGPIYNPFGKAHGAPEDAERNVGDLGNIEPNPDGVATGKRKDAHINLCGLHSVIGRAFVVHADPDDLGKGGDEASKVNGNVGAGIGCGVIVLE